VRVARQQAGLLVGEVLVERALGDPGVPHDVGDRRCGVPLLGRRRGERADEA
jgi:hypothetical protein